MNVLDQIKRAWSAARGYRTMVLHALYAVWGVVVVFDWQLVVSDPATLGKISFGIAVVGALLRLDTHGPVGGEK